MRTLLGLAKQITATKHAFNAFLFKDSHLQRFPRPGYWDLGPCLLSTLRQQKVVIKTRKSLRTSSSPAEESRSKPRVKPSKSNGASSAGFDSPAPVIEPSGTPRLIDPRASPKKSPAETAALSTKLKRVSLLAQKLSPKPSELPQPAPVTPLSTPQRYILRSYLCFRISYSVCIQPDRQGAKPHIQLDVLAADNLMAANKRTSVRDAVPDRKPSARVTLYLPKNFAPPSSSSNSSDELRKVFQCRLCYFKIFCCNFFILDMLFFNFYH